VEVAEGGRNLPPLCRIGAAFSPVRLRQVAPALLIESAPPPQDLDNLFAAFRKPYGQ